jgi:hypothetical protein
MKTDRLERHIKRTAHKVTSNMEKFVTRKGSERNRVSKEEFSSASDVTVNSDVWVYLLGWT